MIHYLILAAWRSMEIKDSALWLQKPIIYRLLQKKILFAFYRNEKCIYLTVEIILLRKRKVVVKIYEENILVSKKFVCFANDGLSTIPMTTKSY